MNSEPSTPHQPGPDDDATGDAPIMKSRRQRSPEPSNNGLDDTALSHPVSGTTTQKSLITQSFKPRPRADRRTTVSHTPAPESPSSCSDRSVSYALNCRRPIIGLSNRYRGDSGPMRDTGRKPSLNRAFQRYIHDHMCRRQRHRPILLMWSSHLS